jgi:hypothetical protein
LASWELAQDVGGLALEGAHFVLVVALDMIGHGEAAHGVVAQIKGEEVAGGKMT